MIEYTKLSDALAELEKRKHLRPRIEAFLAEQGVGLPWAEDLGGGKPLAVLFRQIATPNYENVRFCGISEGLDLKPIFLEYTADKFSTENDYKLSLARIPIMRRIGRNGDVNFRRIWVCDEETKSYAPLKDLHTQRGTSLVDFHHSLLSSNPNTRGVPTVDISVWVKKAGCLQAKDYYPLVLALFASHAILFENFLSKGKEGDFVKNVASVAARQIEEKFGVRPLVVPLNPTDIEASEFWFCQYPDVLSKCWEERLEKNES